MRRTLAAVLVVPALVAAGCGPKPNAEQQRRAAFLMTYKKLKDPELAAVCPSLYPADFLKNPKKYRYDRKDLGYKPTAQQKADAAAVGCTAQGTPPKK